MYRPQAQIYWSCPKVGHGSQGTWRPSNQATGKQEQFFVARYPLGIRGFLAAVAAAAVLHLEWRESNVDAARI
jgi:hypothetical protein